MCKAQAPVSYRTPTRAKPCRIPTTGSGRKPTTAPAAGGHPTRKPFCPSAASPCAGGRTSAEHATPLRSVLQQYRTAESAWQAEKATLRRDLVAHRKKLAAVEQDLQRMT